MNEPTRDNQGQELHPGAARADHAGHIPGEVCEGDPVPPAKANLPQAEDEGSQEAQEVSF